MAKQAADSGPSHSRRDGSAPPAQGAAATAVEIRPGGPGDLDAIAELERRVFTFDRLSRRSLRLFLAKRPSKVLVAHAGDRLAGYALVLVRSDSAAARLYSMAVDPDFPGGLGRRLLNACEALAREHGSRSLRLEVRPDNARAIGLYTSNGYRATGRLGGYYEDGAPALKFERDLL